MDLRDFTRKTLYKTNVKILQYYCVYLFMLYNYIIDLKYYNIAIILFQSC